MISDDDGTDEVQPDLFVDSNLSGHFARPVKPKYRQLIRWLMKEGCLVVCRSLVREYVTAVRGAESQTTLPAIVNRLQRDGRLTHFSKNELQAFRIKPSAQRRLRSNRADHDFIKIVLLSDRKIGLSKDRNLARDINDFPGYEAQVASTPSKIDYRS